MVCPNCGNQIGDDVKFCPFCGGQTNANQQANGQQANGQQAYNQQANGQQSYGQQFQNAANNMFDKTENEFRSAFNDVQRNFSGNNQGGTGMRERLKEDRSLLPYILLNIVTCGIYGYYFLYQMAHDVNIACEGDGEHTAGLVQLILLSLITCGIYSWIWQYKLGNRLANNAARYGMTFQENGTTILMWDLFGAILCGIGPFIAMNILIKNSNAICIAYNRNNGF